MYVERLPKDISPDLFINVKYFVTGDVREEVLDCLSRGGAKKSYYLSTFTTHLVVGREGSPDDVSEAEEMLDIQPVDQDWVLASAYAGARLPLAAFRVSGSRLLSSLVVVLGSDLTETDRDKLWAMITWHGGKVVSSLGDTVTHLVTTRVRTVEEKGPAVITVTPNWVVETIMHSKLLDPNREDFRQFTVIDDAERDVGDTHEVFVAKKKKKAQKLSPADFSQYFKKQDEVIRKYLNGKTSEERNVFHFQLDNEGKKQFVMNNGLFIKVEDGQICLTEFQKEILSRPQEIEILAGGKEVPETVVFTNEEGEKKETAASTSEEEGNECERSLPFQSSPISQDQRKPKEEEEEDEKRKQNLLNLGPKRDKKEFKLTRAQEKVMMRMNRQQRYLYLKKLEKEFEKNPSKYLANQREERNAFTNIDNLQSPRVGIPSKAKRITSSDSPVLTSSPSSPYVGLSSDKPVSAKICLLGCTFLITGYQDQAEVEYVPKWSVIIERHGGNVVDALTDQVTHVLAPRQTSPQVQEALASQKRVVTAHWLNDIIKMKLLRPPWKAVHFPLPPVQLTDCTKMDVTITGFIDTERDYVKDMIEYAGASYSSSFTKKNSVIICKAFKGNKYKTSQDWKIPAVSISWLNDVLFGPEDVSGKVNSSVYKRFSVEEEDLGIRTELVSHLLEAWKEPVMVNRDTYYKYREKERQSKRSLNYDQTILAPDRKKMKFDPRILFEKTSQTKGNANDETKRESADGDDEEVNFDFYLQRRNLFTDKTFFLTPDVKPSVEILKNMIENSGGRVEVGDLKSQIRKSEQQDRRDLIIITSSAGSVKDLPLDGIKIFTSEFVINSILNCNIDFENNIHSLMQKMSVSGKRVI